MEIDTTIVKEEIPEASLASTELASKGLHDAQTSKLLYYYNIILCVFQISRLWGRNCIGWGSAGKGSLKFFSAVNWGGGFLIVG